MERPETEPRTGSTSAETRAAEMVDAAVAGDRRALARLLTAVENRTALAEPALRRLHPLAGRAQIVGITGAPGAGKSTLVSSLIGAVRESGRKIAVIAVDPSSPITGGALLGDRVRMQQYAADADVFIRSMASRGRVGGLAPMTAAAAVVFDACGFDLVVIETVGTGQSEVDIAAAADTTVVVQAPEMGDEIQAIKAGLLEVAEIVVVNKGDRPGAQRAATELKAMLGLSRLDTHDERDSSTELPGAPANPEGVGTGEDGGSVEATKAAAPAQGQRYGDQPRLRRRPRPEVLLTVATTGQGIPELLAAIDRHRTSAAADRDAARIARAEILVWSIVEERLHRWFDEAEREGVERDDSLGRAIEAVARHESDPYELAERLLGAFAAALQGDRELR